MPPEAAPVIAAPAATPASPVTAPVAVPARHAPSVRRTIGGVQPKQVNVRPANHTPAPAPSPTSAPVPQSDVPGAIASPATAPGAVPPVPGYAPGASDSVAGTDVAATPEVPPAPVLTAAEEAKRIARINKAEAKLAQQRQDWQQEQARSSQEVAQLREHQRAFTELAKVAQQDPLGFMQRTFGLSPQKVLDLLIAEGSKDPSSRVAETSSRETAELRAKIAELEKGVQTASQAQQERALAEQQSQYMAAYVAPVLADKARYELTNRALGDTAVNEVFALIQKRYQVTQAEVQRGLRKSPETLRPEQAADMIENHLRSQRDLLSGANVAPATQSRKEPPPVPQAAPKTPTNSGAFKLKPKNVNITTKKW